MALKTVAGSVDYVGWGEVEPGVTIKGFFKETRPNAKYPENMNHYIESIEGKLYGLNGTANLDRAMEQIKQGWWVEITYNGQTTLENGRFAGRPCHQFAVAYDDERIHPLFGGTPDAHKPVEYKQDPAAEAIPPEKSAETAKEQPAAKEPPALAKPSGEKRKLF